MPETIDLLLKDLRLPAFIRHYQRHQEQAVGKLVNQQNPAIPGSLFSLLTVTLQCFGENCGFQMFNTRSINSLRPPALTYDLTVVTRNVKDLEHTGVRLLNPFID